MDGSGGIRQPVVIVRLLFVADLHYALRQFDWLVANAGGFDAVIIGGDLLDLGSPLEPEVQIVVTEKYLARICRQTRLLVTSGNHDGDARSEANESVCRWLQALKGDRLHIDGESVDLGSTRVTLCPWWDGPTSQAEVEQMLAAEAQQRRSERWIWIHHSPPDRSPVSWAGRKFGGDECLVEWIQRYEPDLVLSGHIHNAPFLASGSWIDRIGRTWVFNPGRQIGPQPTFLVFDFDQMSVEWVSMEGQVVQRLDVPADAGFKTGAPEAAGA